MPRHGEAVLSLAGSHHLEVPIPGRPRPQKSGLSRSLQGLAVCGGHGVPGEGPHVGAGPWGQRGGWCAVAQPPEQPERAEGRLTEQACSLTAGRHPGRHVVTRRKFRGKYIPVGHGSRAARVTQLCRDTVGLGHVGELPSWMGIPRPHQSPLPLPGVPSQGAVGPGPPQGAAATTPPPPIIGPAPP